jgi:hypothetical protein
LQTNQINAQREEAKWRQSATPLYNEKFMRGQSPEPSSNEHRIESMQINFNHLN